MSHMHTHTNKHFYHAFCLIQRLWSLMGSSHFGTWLAQRTDLSSDSSYHCNHSWGWMGTLTEVAQGCLPFQNSCWPLLVDAFLQCAFSSLFTMFLWCQSNSSQPKCECCLNFINFMLYEQRFFSQFNAVFSSCFGIWLTHCSQCMEVRLFQTTPRLHKKVIMLFVIKGPDSDYSEAKGCISGNAGRATRAVKTALLLQIKVNSIFLILWTSQHEHILQMLIARGNKVSPAYIFPSNLWGEHTSW